MAKDAYYFSHDSNSRHDPKCLKLQAKFGMEGYGIFWVVVETLREHTEYKVPLSDIDAIDMDCKCNAKAVIDYCIEMGLLCSDDTFFWAPSLLKRMKHLDKIRVKRSASAKKRWSKPKETIVKESKVKESSLHSKSNANAVQKHDVDIVIPEHLKDLWPSFMEIRTKLKAVNSNRAITMILNDLKKYTEQEQLQMVEKAIKNSWKDVYPLNGKQQSPQSQDNPYAGTAKL